ncbi:HNH endonuclease signature motif containing protein [Mesorhizobium sp.]|nr:HNH endonuclease signature motif containing protein [Mesorhizobium sp.]RWM46057.1 MAG: HNH endonuclease [Mesorhizobium sp.]RWM52326.1 MAG: HNH endonuclease [Mesorhizobium sp.]RWM56659.1 MAG: HNH endonuclease [Mesorhizobium sp.]RWN00280.1 MAG: HNH endonuclease [Mesorhizobium sp.]TIO69444.1 MAG: HNH endonuclease [Mesorhizobium sp.]
MDADRAAKLTDEGWTLNKLKLATRDELKAAGLDSRFIASIFKETRPPIPTDTLMSVLFANRYQCCICRNPKRSVIVHHIEEWAESRLHDAENLAVLCLPHHDEAHSKKTLSKNLDAKALRDAKAKWEARVKQFDAESILSAMRLEYSNWNFMNELRIFELARVIGIELKRIFQFDQLVKSGIAERSGLPAVRDNSLFYMYQGSDILARYFYVSEVLSLVIKNLPIINISDYLDKGVLSFALAPGDFIFVQGAHTFSPTTQKKNGKGRGQICRGVRKANNVEVRFTFDRWEATSSSAKSEWLTGTKNQGSLIHVKDLSRDEGRLVVTGTVLGICSNFGDLKRRDYAKGLGRAIQLGRVEEYEDDDDWDKDQ